MSTELIYISFVVIIIIWALYSELKNTNKKFESATCKVNQLELEIKNICDKNKKKVAFTFNEYTYNGKGQLIKIYVFEDVSALGPEYTDEYVIKKKYKNDLLILEETYLIEDKGIEILIDYYVSSYEGNVNTVLNYSISDDKPVLESKQIIDISNIKKLKKHTEINYNKDLNISHEAEIIEKFDDNNNLVDYSYQSIEDDSFQFVYKFDMGVKTEKKHFVNGDLKSVEKYLYNSKNVLTRIERETIGIIDKTMDIFPKTKSDFHNTIIESSELSNLSDLEVKYLNDFSHLLFSSNFSIKYTYDSSGVKITVDKIINVNKD